jgi:hypothetical protein
MKRMSAVLAGCILAACCAAAAAAQPAGGTPTYTNARVVTINALDRTFVIRQADGTQQTVELDDNVAGFGEVRVGDEVILALRAEPGRPRASSIRKSTASAPSRTAPAGPGPLAPASGAVAATDAFARHVADLAAEADRVDRLWSAFRTTCDATVGGRYEGGREWFGLWANDVRADLSNGTCRDLYNQIVGLGETVKRGMTGAEDAARRSLSPGDIRDVRLRYSMDWDGWALPAPERQRL